MEAAFELYTHEQRGSTEDAFFLLFIKKSFKSRFHSPPDSFLFPLSSSQTTPEPQASLDLVDLVLFSTSCSFLPQQNAVDCICSQICLLHENWDFSGFL